MRYTLGYALAYLGIMTALIYEVMDPDRGGPWVLPLLALAQVGAGFAIGKWWAPILSIALIPIAVPAGYPAIDGGEPLPLWFGVAFLQVFGIPLILLGVAGRKLVDRPRAAGVT